MRPLRTGSPENGISQDLNPIESMVWRKVGVAVEDQEPRYQMCHQQQAQGNFQALKISETVNLLQALKIRETVNLLQSSRSKTRESDIKFCHLECNVAHTVAPIPINLSNKCGFHSISYLIIYYYCLTASTALH